jgi:hypothetical protein
MVTISSALSSSRELRMRFSRSLSGAALRGAGDLAGFFALDFALGAFFAVFFAGAFLTAFLAAGFLAVFFFFAGLRGYSSG